MANEDEGSKPGRKQPEGERKFSQKHYDLLKSCSDKKDMTEWNEWRENNPNEDILLEGQDFTGWYLKGADLYKGGIIDTKSLSIQIYKGDVFLKDTKFFDAHLEQAKPTSFLVAIQSLDFSVFQNHPAESCLVFAQLSKFLSLFLSFVIPTFLFLFRIDSFSPSSHSRRAVIGGGFLYIKVLGDIIPKSTFADIPEAKRMSKITSFCFFF